MKILATTYDPYFNPEDFDIYDALIPYIGSYAAYLTGWAGYCELQRVADSNSVDGYTYNVIWHDNLNEVDSFPWKANEIDSFSWKTSKVDSPLWRINNNGYVIQVMRTRSPYGLPDYCKSEREFYTAVRRVFGYGDGLTKIDI